MMKSNYLNCPLAIDFKHGQLMQSDAMAGMIHASHLKLDGMKLSFWSQHYVQITFSRNSR